MEAKIMPTIKNISRKPKMLNGFIVQEGHTATVNDKQAESLVAEYPEQWTLVGGAAKIAPAPAPTLTPAPLPKREKGKRSGKKK